MGGLWRNLQNKAEHTHTSVDTVNYLTVQLNMALACKANQITLSMINFSNDELTVSAHCRVESQQDTLSPSLGSSKGAVGITGINKSFQLYLNIPK